MSTNKPRRCDLMATWEIREPGLLEFGDFAGLELYSNRLGLSIEHEGDALPSRLASVLYEADELAAMQKEYLDVVLREVEELEQYPAQHAVQQELCGKRLKAVYATKQWEEAEARANALIANYDAQDVPEVEDNVSEELDEYNKTHWELVWKEGFEVLFQLKMFIDKCNAMPVSKAVDLLSRALKRLRMKTYLCSWKGVVKKDSKGQLIKAGGLSYPHYAAGKLLCIRALASRGVSWAVKQLPKEEESYLKNKIRERLTNATTIPDSVFIRNEPESVMGSTGIDWREMEEHIDLHRYCERKAQKKGIDALEQYKWLVENEEDNEPQADAADAIDPKYYR